MHAHGTKTRSEFAVAFLTHPPLGLPVNGRTVEADGALRRWRVAVVGREVRRRPEEGMRPGHRWRCVHFTPRERAGSPTGALRTSTVLGAPVAAPARLSGAGCTSTVPGAPVAARPEVSGVKYTQAGRRAGNPRRRGYPRLPLPREALPFVPTPRARKATLRARGAERRRRRANPISSRRRRPRASPIS